MLSVKQHKRATTNLLNLLLRQTSILLSSALLAPIEKTPEEKHNMGFQHTQKIWQNTTHIKLLCKNGVKTFLEKQVSKLTQVIPRIWLSLP